MKGIVDILYGFVLSLWVGGMSLFTFLIAPVIFKAHGRDTAGSIVGHILPYYFLYLLFLSGIALFLFLVSTRPSSRAIAILTLALLVTAVLISAIHLIYFIPTMEELKAAIGSFETMPQAHPLRSRFSALHGISATLNLLLLLEGIVLFVLHRMYPR